MKFMLENPSFTNGPVEIDNKQAVKQITAYINKPIILGDEILIVVDGLPLKLQWIDIKDDEYKFINVRLKRCEQCPFMNYRKLDQGEFKILKPKEKK